MTFSVDTHTHKCKRSSFRISYLSNRWLFVSGEHLLANHFRFQIIFVLSSRTMNSILEYERLFRFPIALTSSSCVSTSLCLKKTNAYWSILYFAQRNSVDVECWCETLTPQYSNDDWVCWFFATCQINVSLYDDSRGKKIFPLPILSIFGDLYKFLNIAYTTNKYE